MPIDRHDPARRSRPHDHRAGFTLIELLVVVIVVGLLAAIAVPVYLNQRDKATAATLRADYTQVVRLMQELHDTRVYPPQCYSADACAAPGGPTARLLAAPYELQLSPGNRIGDFWSGGTTFHLCIEHWEGGQPTHWMAAETATGSFQSFAGGSTQGCPWISVNTREPGR